MNSNSTSLLKDYEDPAGSHYASKPYGDSPSHVALTEYDESSKLFTNVNSADCEGFTLCELKPAGCSGTYSETGRAAMDSSTFALSIT
jgi:hypothetical protein